MLASQRWGETEGPGGPRIRRREGFSARGSLPEEPDNPLSPRPDLRPLPPLPSCRAPVAHSQAGTSSTKSVFCVRSRCRSCRTMWRFQRATGTPGAPGPAIAALPPTRRAAPTEGGATGAGPLGDSVTSGGGSGGDSPDRPKSVRRGRKPSECAGKPTPGSTAPGPHQKFSPTSGSYCCPPQ